MKQDEFQDVARQFRAGKISLPEFTSRVFPQQEKAALKCGTADMESIWDRLMSRETDSHKGDFGRVLVIAGSPGMAGAAGLTGLAALRSGAGLVTIATDEVCQSTVAGFHPSLMTAGIPVDDQGELTVVDYSELSAMVPRHNCIAIGPGLGQSKSTQMLVRDVVANSPVPVVVDADAINCLGRVNDFTESASGILFTPHAGELMRLMDHPSTDRDQQKTFASQLAQSVKGVVVLKGHQTFITSGSHFALNRTGNPGMATAGSGDVLTGIIVALAGQGLSIWEAAVLGCYVHGRAGDLAAESGCRVTLIASDIIDFLPAAFSDPGFGDQANAQ